MKFEKILGYTSFIWLPLAVWCITVILMYCTPYMNMWLALLMMILLGLSLIYGLYNSWILIKKDYLAYKIDALKDKYTHNFNLAINEWIPSNCQKIHDNADRVILWNVNGDKYFSSLMEFVDFIKESHAEWSGERVIPDKIGFSRQFDNIFNYLNSVNVFLKDSSLSVNNSSAIKFAQIKEVRLECKTRVVHGQSSTETQYDSNLKGNINSLVVGDSIMVANSRMSAGIKGSSFSTTCQMPDEIIKNYVIMIITKDYNNPLITVEIGNNLELAYSILNILNLIIFPND